MRQVINDILRKAVLTADPILLDFLGTVWGSDDFNIPELAWFYDRQAQLRNQYFKHAQDRLYSRVLLQTYIKMIYPNMTSEELNDIEDKNLIRVIGSGRGTDDKTLFEAQLKQALEHILKEEVFVLIEGSFEGLQHLCIEHYTEQEEDGIVFNRLTSREFLSIDDEEAGLTDEEKKERKANRERALTSEYEKAQAYKNRFLKNALTELEKSPSVRGITSFYSGMLESASLAECKVKNWQTAESNIYLGLEQALVEQKKTRAKYVSVLVDRLRSDAGGIGQECYHLLAEAAMPHAKSNEPEAIHQFIKNQFSHANVWCTDVIDERTGDTLLHLAAKAGAKEVYRRIFGPQQLPALPGYIVQNRQSSDSIWQQVFSVKPQVALNQLVLNINLVQTLLRPAILAIIPEMRREQARLSRGESADSFSTQSKLANQLLQDFANSDIDFENLDTENFSGKYREAVYVYLHTVIRSSASWVHPALLHAYALISNTELWLWLANDDYSLKPYTRFREEGINYAKFLPETPAEERIDLLMRSKSSDECQRLKFKGYGVECFPTEDCVVYPYTESRKIGATRRLTFLEQALTDPYVMSKSAMKDYDKVFGQGKAALLKDALLEIGRENQFALCEENKAAEYFFHIVDSGGNTALHHLMQLGLSNFAFQIVYFGADLTKKNNQQEVACKVFDPEGNTLAHCAYNAQEHYLVLKMISTYSVDIEILNEHEEALIGLIKRDVEMAYLQGDESALAKSRLKLYQMIRQFFTVQRRSYERWQAIKDTLLNASIPAFTDLSAADVRELQLIARVRAELIAPALLAKIEALNTAQSKADTTLSQVELVSLISMLRYTKSRDTTEETDRRLNPPELRELVVEALDGEKSHPVLAKIESAVGNFLKGKPHADLTETLLYSLGSSERQVEASHLELASPTELGEDGKARVWSPFECDMDNLLFDLDESETKKMLGWEQKERQLAQKRGLDGKDQMDRKMQGASFLTRLRAGCLTHRAYEHQLYEREAIRHQLELDTFLSHIQQHDLPLFTRAKRDKRVRRLGSEESQKIAEYVEKAAGSTEYALGIKEHFDTLEALDISQAQTAQAQEQTAQAREQAAQERQEKERAQARVRELEEALRRANAGQGAGGPRPGFFG